MSDRPDVIELVSMADGSVAQTIELPPAPAPNADDDGLVLDTESMK